LEVYLVEDDGAVFEVGRIAVPGDDAATTAYHDDPSRLSPGKATDPACEREITEGLDDLAEDGYALSSGVREIREALRARAPSDEG
ncbi:hypothetical protein ACWCQL_32625, partial [Streptomyces sp. NPDC002073]